MRVRQETKSGRQGGVWALWHFCVFNDLIVLLSAAPGSLEIPLPIVGTDVAQTGEDAE